MTKCGLCDMDAEFFIKGSNGGYCKDCAEDGFADVSYLLSAEEQAKALKKVIDKKFS